MVDRQVEVLRSETFARWLDGLRDRSAAVKITVRIDRLACGNPGDVKPVGEGISELRINHGPGYRVYFMRRSAFLVVLLCGGAKSTQKRDIARAKAIAAEFKE